MTRRVETQIKLFGLNQEISSIIQQHLTMECSRKEEFYSLLQMTTQKLTRI
ncbi:MAG: hypothetical protein RMY34_11150 [Aulosira sp. DedQUE10]|nr:hypothetical protein [Aulosira sp. DedQUE10]